MPKVSKKSPTKTVSRYSLKIVFPWLLITGGSIGLVSAIILLVEKIHLLKNPGAVLSCDLNPIVACGSVINTPQASVFGFPNPVLGLIGFSVLITVGVAILAGARFARWFWVSLQLGTVFGIGFITWLQYQSIYEIGALCPYCMVVWAVMIPLFVYTTAYNLREGTVRLPNALTRVSTILQRYPAEILFTWYLVIIMAILEHFWFYWETLV